MMSAIQEKWKDIKTGVCDTYFVLLLICPMLVVGLDLEEVNSIVPTLTNISVNWLKVYDITGISSDHMLYPLQYVLMLLWGELPFFIFQIIVGGVSEFSLFLLAVWYKILGIFILYKVFFYTRKIVETYQKQTVTCSASWLCAVPIIIYNVIWPGNWNIILVLLLLMGLYYYLQEQMFLFVICMLFAILCRPAVIFFYLPLVLWKKKSIKGICDYLICLLLPLCIELIMFISSEGFRSLLGTVIRQWGGEDMAIWIVCLVLSVIAFLDKQMQYKKRVAYMYVIIALTLWLANGRKEGYLLLLAAVMTLICIQVRNVAEIKKNVG